MMTRKLLTVKDWVRGIDIPVRFLILQIFILAVIALGLVL